MSADAQVMERNAIGQWLPGQSGNPKGAAVGRRRFALAVERELEEPECIRTMAENFVKGLKNPDAKPVTGRIAWDRFWPVVSKHELRTDGGLAPESSANQWDALAARAGSELPALANVAVEEPDAGPIEGVD